MSKKGRDDVFRCVQCGKYIPYSQMAEGGGATFEFTPDTEYTIERNEWSCKACSDKEKNTERKR